MGIGATSENGSVVELEPDRSDHCRKRGMSEREATAKDRSCSVRCSSVKRGLDILAATSAKSLSREQAFIKLADRTERLRVPEIAAALGVSERTIRNDFERLFGIAPVRFLKLRRMQAARRALLAGEANVTRIAVEHGFYAFGRFAAEYRAVFGEPPSQTLKGAHGAVGRGRAANRLVVRTEVAAVGIAAAVILGECSSSCN